MDWVVEGGSQRPDGGDRRDGAGFGEGTDTSGVDLLVCVVYIYTGERFCAHTHTNTTSSEEDMTWYTATIHCTRM